MKKLVSVLILFVSMCACSEDGVRDTPIPDQTITCGNSILDLNEDCDGTTFRFTTECTPYGYTGGKVKCTSECEVDFSDCFNTPIYNLPVQEESKVNSVCGNGIREGEEECDSRHPVSLCSVKGNYTTGQVYCTQDCKFDYSQCSNSVEETKEDIKPICGNGVLEVGEDCDTKSSLGDCSQYGDFNRGQVYCSSSCTLNLSNCSKEVVEDPPVIDPPVIDPPIVTPEEPVCGNGVKEEGEECDDGNQVDTDLCTNSCKTPICGDGILSNGEECDGNNIPITSCMAFNPNFNSGTLKCTADCKIDPSSCTTVSKCGNGVVDSYMEECDGSAGKHSCKDLSINHTGYVNCVGCKIDYSECVDGCLTNKTFSDGKYINSNTSFHKVTEKGNTYIVMDSKVGVLVDNNTIQWIYSSVGDEGYYSYFKSGSCECSFCDIALSSNSYLNKDEVKSTSLTQFKYDKPTITEVPTFTISSLTIPENLKTGDTPYYSCNHKECSDKLLNYLNITSSRFIISTQDLNWNFSLIRDLGNDIYLVHYESGYNLPQELQLEGLTKPFAVIKITKGNPYTVCDIDNAQDITIQVLSWDKYRDVAVAKANFNSTTSFTYKPALKYSKDLCIKENEYSFLAYVTEVGKEGEDIFRISLGPKEFDIIYYENLCYDKNIIGNQVLTKENYILILGTWFKSLYRENVVVFSPSYGKKTHYNSYPKSKFNAEDTDIEIEGVTYELEHPYLKDYLKCKGLSFKNYSTGVGCEISLVDVAQLSQPMKFCKVTKDNKECKYFTLWYLWNNVPSNLQPKTCTSKN